MQKGGKCCRKQQNRQKWTERGKITERGMKAKNKQKGRKRAEKGKNLPALQSEHM